jgi:23S rRNA (adenine2503-C2)-methyltransferase
MGLGEPLHAPLTYDVTLAAIEVMVTGLGLSRNKVLVSTVGLADGMEAFLTSRDGGPPAKLALSLHATTDEVRSLAGLQLG